MKGIKKIRKLARNILRNLCKISITLYKGYQFYDKSGGFKYNFVVGSAVITLCTGKFPLTQISKTGIFSLIPGNNVHTSLNDPSSNNKKTGRWKTVHFCVTRRVGTYVVSSTLEPSTLTCEWFVLWTAPEV